MNEIDKRITTLTDKLRKLLSCKPITFSVANSFNSSGIYIIYQNGKEIYVGKTKRQLKKRLTEMATYFRSHTLNRKLMTKLLETNFGLNLNRKIRNNDKEKLIAEGQITEKQFSTAQRDVNKIIRDTFKIKFVEAFGKALTDLEHFAIAVLSPKYND